MLRTILLLAFSYGLIVSAAYACDTPVVYEEVALTGKTVLDPETQKYKIIIDPDTPALIGEEGMRFLLAHECAHVELDHIPQMDEASKHMSPIQLQKQMFEIEMEADCHAVKKLVANGDREAIQAGLELISVSQTTTTPLAGFSSYQRISKIKKCEAATVKERKAKS